MTQNPQDPQNPGNQPEDPNEGAAPPPSEPTQSEVPEQAPPAPPAPQQPTYGSVVPPAPEQPGYGAPQAPSYGSSSTPPPAPQQPGYGAPQQPGYGAPQPPSYGSSSTPPPPPQQPSYGAPQPPSYGSGSTPPPPQQPGYGAPQQPGYGAPQQPGYGAPQQPGYGAPQQPGYGAPQQPGGFPSAPPPPGGYGQYGAPGYGGPGGPQPFSVGNAIGYGWNAFKANAGPWIGGFLVVVLLSALVNWLLNPAVRVSYDLGDMSGSGAGGMGMVEYTFAGQLLAGIATIITYMLGAILIQGAVHKVNGRFDGFGAFFRFDHPGPLFLAALLLGVAGLVIGLLSLATPFLSGLLNLVWGILTPFVLYIAADRGTQPIPAIQESIKLVTSNFGSVIVLWLATIGLVIAGVIVVCFTGLIIVVPLLALAWAFAYKTLSGQQVAAP